MKYVVNTCTEPQWNMAHDEFLLEGLTETVFCLWQNRPSVIVGLNQNPYAEVDVQYLEAHHITLARRVTGGGAVYHDLGNLNYSIAGPIAQMEDKFSLMACTLQQLGVPAALSGRNDILVDGRKCSGYAKRLSKNRMMIHGTLMWDVDLETLTRALAVPGSKLEAKGIASVRCRVANIKDYPVPGGAAGTPCRWQSGASSEPGAAGGNRPGCGPKIPYLGVELGPFAAGQFPE